MSNLFPRTVVAGVSLSRMIIGTNWILGWSHRSPAADHQIKNRFPDGKAVFPMLQVFLEEGVHIRKVGSGNTEEVFIV